MATDIKAEAEGTLKFLAFTAVSNDLDAARASSTPESVAAVNVKKLKASVSKDEWQEALLIDAKRDITVLMFAVSCKKAVADASFLSLLIPEDTREKTECLCAGQSAAHSCANLALAFDLRSHGGMPKMLRALKEAIGDHRLWNSLCKSKHQVLARVCLEDSTHVPTKELVQLAVPSGVNEHSWKFWVDECSSKKPVETILALARRLDAGSATAAGSKHGPREVVLRQCVTDKVWKMLAKRTDPDDSDDGEWVEALDSGGAHTTEYYSYEPIDP